MPFLAEIKELVKISSRQERGVPASPLTLNKRLDFFFLNQAGRRRRRKGGEVVTPPPAREEEALG